MKNKKITAISLLIIIILLLVSCTSKNSTGEFKQNMVSEETESVTNTDKNEKNDANSQEWKDTIINPRDIRGKNFEKIHEDIEKTDKYQVQIKIPSTWDGEQGYYNNTIHITFEGCYMLFRTTDNFILDRNIRDVYSIKNFREWDVLEGITKEGYSYVQYKYPNSLLYHIFVQVSKEFIIDFDVNLDDGDEEILKTILDSIKFSEVDKIK